MIKVSLECIHCKSTDVIKAGKNKSPSNPGGTQRYKCKNCMQSFQKDYKHLARLPSVKAKIIEMAINSSGTRDTARVLGIGKDTVTRTLKKRKMTSQE